MKIEVIDTFKSVGPFTWDNIPSLSIITGLNGAGKSQLLELIRTKPPATARILSRGGLIKHRQDNSILTTKFAFIINSVIFEF